MASINNLRKKEDAVRDIESLIKKIDSANRFLNSIGSPTGHYEISYFVDDGEYGFTVKTGMVCRDADIFKPMIKENRDRLAAEVERIANEYDILISTDEKNILDKAKTVK